MNNFKSVIIIKHPRDKVWLAIRDNLSDLVPHLDDVASITTEKREKQADDVLLLVNLWKADIAIPAVLTSMIDPDSLRWTDRAAWNEQEYKCHWQIEPHFFADRISCNGTTSYEPAIGGRGTRITFEGQLEVSTHNLPGLPAILEKGADSAVEMLVTTLIPKNFRKVTDALSGTL